MYAITDDFLQDTKDVRARDVGLLLHLLMLP
jgi:hypothetical protein